MSEQERIKQAILDELKLIVFAVEEDRVSPEFLSGYVDFFARQTAPKMRELAKLRASKKP